MRKRGSWVALLGPVLAVGCLLISAGSASATIFINVPNFDLLPDTPGQTIQISVSTDAADQVGGCALNAQVDAAGVAYGGVAGPAITAVDLETGTIFAGNNTGQQDLGDPSPPQLAMYGIVTSSGTVLAQGLLVTLTLDTTGFTTVGSQWTLQLGDTLNESTNFSPTVPVIVDGSITLVPEPATLALLALGGAMALVRRRRAAR